jgi:VWFA-related protein
MLPVREGVITAASAFAETSNRDDEIFALTFNERVNAVLPATAPFTGDAGALRAALRGAFLPRGRTALHDAVAAGLEYVSRGRHLGKVLVVVSDGGDNASAATFDGILRATQIANTVVYTIAVVDPLERDVNPKRLEKLAEASGGEAFRPSSLAGIEETFRRIAHDIRNTYTIGYVPPDAARGNAFRRIEVLVSAPGRRGLRVRARQGYLLGEQ